MQSAEIDAVTQSAQEYKSGKNMIVLEAVEVHADMLLDDEDEG